MFLDPAFNILVLITSCVNTDPGMFQTRAIKKHSILHMTYVMICDIMIIHGLSSVAFNLSYHDISGILWCI